MEKFGEQFMANAIENFVATKLFGGITGANNKKVNKENNKNTYVKFNSSVSYGDKYINQLKEKQARANSKWNNIKQRFGFGEELTAEEQKILHNERRKEIRRNASEVFGGDFSWH